MNWFHLSNVLPLIGHSGYGIPWGRSIELKWLGYLIKRSYKNVEVLSSESNYSLSLFPSSLHCSFVVSPNGSDEEVELFGLYTSRAVDNVAVVVGTFFYKDLNSSYSIFIELQKTTPDLMLVIIGDQSSIPSIIKDDKRVEAVGNLSHEQVIDLLSSARFYINTSKVENSWNSASEGVLLAQESFISNIEPHMELADIVTRRRYVEYNNILHISRQSVVPDNLPVWSVLISNMVNFIKLKKYV